MRTLHGHNLLLVQRFFGMFHIDADPPAQLAPMLGVMINLVLILVMGFDPGSESLQEPQIITMAAGLLLSGDAQTAHGRG